MNRSAEKQCTCTIYLMRHGDSRRDTVRRFIGRSDHPLNDAGRSQVEWWHRKLAKIPFSRIYCSDLKRSVETARIVSRRMPVPFSVMPELREIDLGRWDGMPVSEVRRLFPQEYILRGAGLAGYRPEGGESFADLAARVVPAFESLVQQAGEHLLVVGHAGVNRVILCHVLGMPLTNLFCLDQSYGCLNILEYSAGTWVLRQMNLLAGIHSAER